MQDKAKDLSVYRINSALETLDAAKVCIESKHYKDAINRSYYATFYAIKAVLAMEGIDFRRHKDVVAYFNHFSEKALQCGIREWVLDPGFGFAKTLEQNYEMLSRLDEFKVFDRPVLTGVSRKSMIYKRKSVPLAN